MMIPRHIVGPQERFERSGSQSLRDIRPFAVRASEILRSSASGIVLGMLGAVTYAEPAVLDITLPVSLAYSAWVLTRRVGLPLRLPVSAAAFDYGDPEPGTRKARPAAGTIFIGWDVDGREMWITAEDARQHMTVPGTTGAGKTSVLLSLLTNSLAQGSGFVLVDGKADRDLFSKVVGLARRFGREDDVRLLNFMVASGTKDSHTFQAFAMGNADAVRELLVSQLGEQSENDSNGVFRDRAVALIGTIAPALVWLRDNEGVSLSIDVIRSAIRLKWIWKLAMESTYISIDPVTGAEESRVVKMPIKLLLPLKAYMGELPGYVADMPLEKQTGEKPFEQHGYAQMYFTRTLAQLGDSLGHIFNVESGDVDMRDVVLNRRILVVNLPALENSDATLAALGKLVVASLRGMMAQLLGVSPEGDYTVEDKPGMGPSPYPIVLDELAYYATSGLDRMLAMGRGLNISFMLGFQEVSGIWARLGEKTGSLLGNANLTIAMRQQDSGRTRDWLEKTAGQTNVTQATSYEGAMDGNYRETRQAEVRTVSRVDWRDLTSLEPGEAIVLLKSRRVYAKAFFAKIDDAGPKRLGRTLMLRAPDLSALRDRHEKTLRLAGTISSGKVNLGDAEPPSTGLKAILRGYQRASKAGSNVRGCVQEALAEIATIPSADLPRRPPAPKDGTPVTSLTAMLTAASTAVTGGYAAELLPREPIDDALLRKVMAIEEAAGAAPTASRHTALAVLAARDRAHEAIVQVEPPAMRLEVLTQHIDAVIRQVEAVGGPKLRQAA